MRIVHFETGGTFGIAADEGSGWHGLTQRDDGFPGTLPELIAQGKQLLQIGRSLGQFPAINLNSVRILPPVPAPKKILCVGLNYDDHLEESGLKKPAYPEIFARFATSLIAHQEPIRRPRDQFRSTMKLNLRWCLANQDVAYPTKWRWITWRATPCSTMRPCVIFSFAHRNGPWAKILMAQDRLARGW
jgi:hypothetical protein